MPRNPNALKRLDINEIRRHKYVTVNEAAVLLRRNPDSIYDYIRRSAEGEYKERFPAFRRDRSWLIDREKAEKWLEGGMK